MDASTLIQRLREQRESWVEVSAGKRVKIRRPAEAHMVRLQHGITADILREHVVGWEGITEADLLGAAVGSSDPAPFSADLFVEIAQDRTEWLRRVEEEIVSAVMRHLEAREAAAKN